jgi:hypothetical protein
VNPGSPVLEGPVILSGKKDPGSRTIADFQPEILRCAQDDEAPLCHKYAVLNEHLPHQEVAK